MLRMYNMLESDTNDLGSTIHFDKRNLDTFGIRVYNLFFMSCNLFELAAKEIAGSGKSDMNTWKKVPEICQFSDSEMTFLPMGYKFKPLKALGEVDVNKRNLTWWQEYNSVKHDLTQIQKASLRNLIYALCSAGLLVSHVVDIEVRAIQMPSVMFDGLLLPSIR
ncbi:MAG TPA: hypothetical protein C5S37_11860 [Methanophagales archaeon]|nr:hypothetical protein [Methanophagales archaeon]